MRNCEGCGSSFDTGRQGPRKFCEGCLPSIDLIGKPEYQRRYKLLRAAHPRKLKVTGSVLTVESLALAAVDVLVRYGQRAPVVCVVPACGRKVFGRGFCAKHHAQSKGRGIREANVPKKVKTFYQSAAWRTTRLEILRRDGYRCLLRETRRCRGVANSVDHTIRPEDGGSELDHANLKSCCVPCNTAKRNRQIAERALQNASVGADRAW